ncbi:MAG: hypothetical protein HQL40_17005 [Alphaproteobacteria bacterium]|nr:hypothetical protein [Alphaproteobacteria bacterium]
MSKAVGKDRSVDTRQNATICPLTTNAERTRATDWVRKAIESAQSKGPWNNGFPRYIWFRDDDGQYWIGRVMAPQQGNPPRAAYKGWPVSEAEWRQKFPKGDRL